MSNNFKLCPTHFSRGANIFLGGFARPGYGPERLPFGVTNGISAFQRDIDCFTKTYNLQKVFAYLDDITATGATFAGHDKIRIACLPLRLTVA